jgi:hypothetical protein
VVELLTAAGMLVVGMTVGVLGGRRGGAWGPAAIGLGIAACLGMVLWARGAWACPPGAECEPVTWANWTWLGIELIGLWLLAVAMGYALSLRTR